MATLVCGRDFESAALGQRVSLVVQAGQTSQVVGEFSPGWLESEVGTIVRAGAVIVKFAPERSRACRNSIRGGGLWDIGAVATVQPRGAAARGGLIQQLSRDGSVPSSAPRDLEIAVPSDSRQIETSCHNSAELGCRRDAWD